MKCLCGKCCEFYDDYIIAMFDDDFTLARFRRAFVFTMFDVSMVRMTAANSNPTCFLVNDRLIPNESLFKVQSHHARKKKKDYKVIKQEDGYFLLCRECNKRGIDSIMLTMHNFVSEAQKIHRMAASTGNMKLLLLADEAATDLTRHNSTVIAILKNHLNVACYLLDSAKHKTKLRNLNLMLEYAEGMAHARHRKNDPIIPRLLKKIGDYKNVTNPALMLKALDCCDPNNAIVKHLTMKTFGHRVLKDDI